MSLRHAILGILEYQPRHGYDLKRVLERGVSTFWPVNLAAIYPSLRRLEVEGLVSHHREPTRPGRPDRKVFSVTDRGREELARWRRCPPEVDVPRSRNALYLKLLFAQRENLPDVLDWVRKALDRAQQETAELRDALRDPQAMPLFVRFLRESGLAHLELHVEQLSDLAEQVEQMLLRDDDQPVAGDPLK